MAEENYYHILGVQKTASEAEIKQAFRKLVRKYHPDVNEGVDTSDKVAQLNIAYETLMDADKRAEYDAMQSPFSSFSGFASSGSSRQPEGGFANEKFKEAFNQATSQAYWKEVNSNLQKNWQGMKDKFGEDLPFGTDSVNFDDLVKAFKSNKQEEINKKNHQHYAQQSTTEQFQDFDKFADLFNGLGTYNSSQDGYSKYTQHTQQHTETKAQASKGADQQVEISIYLESVYIGENYRIHLNVPIRQDNGHITHESKELTVKIPKGVVNGQKIRLPEKGSASFGGGKNGDLLLTVKIKHQDNIRLEGANVYQTVNLMPWEAMLGEEVTIDTPAGKLAVSIPANSQTGDTLKIPKKGIPAQPAGDLYLLLKITNPKITQETQQQAHHAYQQLRELFKNNDIKR